MEIDVNVGSAEALQPRVECVYGNRSCGQADCRGAQRQSFMQFEPQFTGQFPAPTTKPPSAVHLREQTRLLRLHSQQVPN
jgi:hypothetical protein